MFLVPKPAAVVAGTISSPSSAHVSYSACKLLKICWGSSERACHQVVQSKEDTQLTLLEQRQTTGSDQSVT